MDNYSIRVKIACETLQLCTGTAIQVSSTKDITVTIQPPSLSGIIALLPARMAPRDIKPSTTFFNSSNTPDPGWYSNTVSARGQQRLVMTSGQAGQRRNGSWPDTFADQVQQAVNNVSSALEAGGASVGDIVKLIFYSVDWSMDLAEDLVSPVLNLLSEKHGAPHRPLTTLVPVPKLAFPEAKFEIEVIALIGGTSEPWRDSKEKGYSAAPVEVDVVVVGGGFSGLAAAYQCHSAGLNTVVLEAKSRIGGRSRSQHLDSGPGVVEMGATWINKTTQPEVFALTQKFGLETVEQYVEGDEIFQGLDGKVVRCPDGTLGNVSGIGVQRTR